ncbi:MAG: DUF4292 domain-containing protein [Crocinitomicaceae bacterium]|nr:DUF4292 domain-containing protein [Crocinitomicaceae bacterium]
MNISVAPQPGTATEIWTSKGASGELMKVMGMTLQKNYFDGKNKGATSGQGQTKQLTEEEIADKKKSYGLIPELNYPSSGMNYKLIGIEKYDGEFCYVLKLIGAKSETYEYFNKESLLKVASTKIVTTEQGTQELAFTFSDFKEYEGFLFPDTTNLSVSGMQIKLKVKSRVMNAKVDLNDFK